MIRIIVKIVLFMYAYLTYPEPDIDPWIPPGDQGYWDHMRTSRTPMGISSIARGAFN